MTCDFVLRKAVATTLHWRHGGCEYFDTPPKGLRVHFDVTGVNKNAPSLAGESVERGWLMGHANP